MSIAAHPKARQVTRSALTHPCPKPGKPGAVTVCGPFERMAE